MVNNFENSSDSDEPTPSQAERAAKLEFARTFFIKIDKIQSPGRKLITIAVVKYYR